MKNIYQITNKARLRLGTRGSPLALVQANMVKNLLEKNHNNSDVEIVTISTSGDKMRETPLKDIGGKALFVKEIEEALIKRDIDFAVHSLKDIPGIIADEFKIAAILPREEVNDVFISAKYQSIKDMPQGAVFGTSSPRRKAQILAIRPDLNVIEFRGNVETRIQKIRDGVADATMLALAGIKRLNLLTDGLNRRIIDINEILPAVGQGAIGIECLQENNIVISILQQISCQKTFMETECERAMLAVIDGNCRTPIAGYAKISDNQITLKGMLASEDGKSSAYHELSGSISEHKKIGEEVGRKLKESRT